MKIANSNVNTSDFTKAVAALFQNGWTVTAMRDCEIGNPRCFKNSTKEIVARINPTAAQINNLERALNDGTLSADDFEALGGEHGGYSTVHLQ